MPYYEEFFANRTLPQTFRSQRLATGVPDSSYDNLAVLDSVKMTSYRSRPHPKAVGPHKVVEDITMDPYANFLNSISERSYREALAARGLVSQGAPDRGHAFEMVRHTVMSRPVSPRGSDRYRTNGGTGYIPAFATSSSHAASREVYRNGAHLLEPTPYQEQDPLSAFAQSAYARVAPTSEMFNAATFLGELREGLPRLVPDILQEAIRAVRRPERAGNGYARGAGSDYLNFQFGWLPLVSEVRNAAAALARATTQLAQEGERVHRKYSIPSQTVSGTVVMDSTSVSGYAGSIRGLLGTEAFTAIGGTETSWGPSPGYGSGSIHKVRRRERWFEGEFSSFYKLGFDPSDYFHRLDALVNVNLTPETLWELSPWSWLVDWGTRLGDSIRANQLAQNDRLVMHYGYAMETAVYRSLHDIVHPDGLRSGSVVSSGWGTSSQTSVTTTYKRRIRANPYGFRVTTPSAFTGGQLAILGALGLTKL